MKTPVRNYKTPANLLSQDIEPDFFEQDYNTQAARWKRKNRIARLKDKIARLTAENKWLSEERLKYIDYYFNTLSDLMKTYEMLEMKKQSRRPAEHRKNNQ